MRDYATADWDMKCEQQCCPVVGGAKDAAIALMQSFMSPQHVQITVL